MAVGEDLRLEPIKNNKFFIFGCYPATVQGEPHDQ